MAKNDMQKKESSGQEITYRQPEQDEKIKRTSTAQSYYNLVRSLSQLLSAARLYEFKHRIFKEKLEQVYSEVKKLLTDNQPLTFFESEGVLLVNRRDIGIKDGLTKRFMDSLRDLEIGYLVLEPGLTLEEFTVFIHILKTEYLKGEDKIKQYLQEKSVKHIVVRAAAYKLVEEDEKVVKKNQVLAVEELSFEIRKRFLEDLKKGEVAQKLQQEEKNYWALAHDPHLLAEIVSDLVKDKDNPEDIAKVLWLIGDYLIGETDTAKEEKINRRAIEQLKKQIFSLWGEEKISKTDMEKHVQKTFAAITLALQLKGLIALYEKHKKNAEKAALQIHEILGILPQESQLYRQTREKLLKIGLLLQK